MPETTTRLETTNWSCPKCDSGWLKIEETFGDTKNEFGFRELLSQKFSCHKCGHPRPEWEQRTYGLSKEELQYRQKRGVLDERFSYKSPTSPQYHAYSKSTKDYREKT